MSFASRQTPSHQPLSHYLAYAYARLTMLRVCSLNLTQPSLIASRTSFSIGFDQANQEKRSQDQHNYCDNRREHRFCRACSTCSESFIRHINKTHSNSEYDNVNHCRVAAGLLKPFILIFTAHLAPPSICWPFFGRCTFAKEGPAMIMPLRAGEVKPRCWRRYKLQSRSRIR